MLLEAMVYPTYHPWIMGTYSVGFPRSFLRKKRHTILFPFVHTLDVSFSPIDLLWWSFVGH
jgi:hypothetical protein